MTGELSLNGDVNSFPIYLFFGRIRRQLLFIKGYIQRGVLEGFVRAVGSQFAVYDSRPLGRNGLLIWQA